MNEVTFTGRAMADPEVRFTSSGTTVVSLPLAVNRYYQKKDGERVETMTRYSVTCWRELGDNVAETVRKGMEIVVQGYLEMEQWNDRDGNTRTTPKLTASDVAVSLRRARADVTKVRAAGSEEGAPPRSAPDEGHFGAAPKVDTPF